MTEKARARIVELHSEWEPPLKGEALHKKFAQVKEFFAISYCDNMGLCTKCKGAGSVGHSSVGGTGIVYPCPDCKGTGKKTKSDERESIRETVQGDPPVVESQQEEGH